MATDRRRHGRRTGARSGAMDMANRLHGLIVETNCWLTTLERGEREAVVDEGQAAEIAECPLSSLSS